MNWETIFKVIASGLGSFVTYLYGGWGGLLPILLLFMCIDQVTGLLASYIEGKLSSRVGGKGIARKVIILGIIAVCYLIDKSFAQTGSYEGQMVMDGAILFYLVNEVLSFVENVGRIGIPLPAQLTNAVAVLKGKSKGDGK